MNHSSTMSLRVVLAGLALLTIGSAYATSPPLTTSEALVEFYQVMDGDNWTRNDNWLDPNVDHCDWHGITCFASGTILSLRLPGNNLAGNLNDTNILEIAERLDLSDNRIRGNLPPVASHTRSVILSHNLLDGELPDMTQERGENLFELDLSNNEFSGDVPASWGSLELYKLDLSSNRLTGTAAAAFAAMSASQGRSIFLADNPFEGTLPAVLTEHNWDINLCWTGLESSDPALADWLAENHVGGPEFDIDTCTHRERLPIDIGLGGSWFNPERDGEGFSLMLLDNGAPAVYWFSHISKDRQIWLFQVGKAEDPTLVFPRWQVSRGRFGDGFASNQPRAYPKGELRLDHIQGDVLHGQYLVNYINFELDQEGDNSFSTAVPMPQRFLQDHVRLSRLAGSHCDNQHDQQWISGIWYDPQRNGEGFVVEVNEDGRGLVYWFTYTPDGEEQAWLVGEGQFDGNTLQIDTLIQPRDTGLGMPFDTAGIEFTDWGALSMEFQDDELGHVMFDSNIPDYGSGAFSVERLARPMLAECDG